MTAPFGTTWGTLCERCEELPEDATLNHAAGEQAVAAFAEAVTG